MTRAELDRVLRNERDQALVPLAWWPEAERAMDDEGVRLVILWAPRQSGKSQFLAREAIYRLLTTPGVYVLYLCASEQQSRAVFARKIRRPLERLVRELQMEPRSLIITKSSVELIDTGAKLEVPATSEFTTPGRSIDLLIPDEGRDVGDEVFSALLPSVIAGQGKVLAASTAGRRRGWFFQMASTPDAETRVIHVPTNTNPYAKPATVDFIGRWLARIAPGFRDREILNRFSDDSVNPLFTAERIEAVIDAGLSELPASPLPAYAFLDLSRRHDLTSMVVVLRDAPRRPEVKDHLTVASVRVWDPTVSPGGEVDFESVRAALAALPTRFPKLDKVLVDEGAEAGAVLPFARSHPALTLRVAGFQATMARNMEVWGALAARVHAGTISLPRHRRLVDELLNLRTEDFSFGTRFRVMDTSKKLHRDVSLSLAGACFAAGEPTVEAATATRESVAEKTGIDPLRAPMPVFGGFFATRSPEHRERLTRVAYGLRDDGDDAGRGGRRFWR